MSVEGSPRGEAPRLSMDIQLLNQVEKQSIGERQPLPERYLRLSDDEMDVRINSLCHRLAGSAPLTVRATREAIRRLTAPALPDGDDLIRLVYGSADFKAGVAAFMAKDKPTWRGE